MLDRKIENIVQEFASEPCAIRCESWQDDDFKVIAAVGIRDWIELEEFGVGRCRSRYTALGVDSRV